MPNPLLFMVIRFDFSVQSVRTKEEKEVLEHFAGVVSFVFLFIH